MRKTKSSSEEDGGSCLSWLFFGGLSKRASDYSDDECDNSGEDSPQHDQYDRYSVNNKKVSEEEAINNFITTAETNSKTTASELGNILSEFSTIVNCKSQLREKFGKTALHQACLRTNTDAVIFLLSHGADANIRDNVS